MRTDIRFRLFCLSLYIITLLSSAKAIPTFLCGYKYAVTLEGTGSGYVSLYSDVIFQPVPPTIPDNPQQSFNSNDFPAPEYKQYPLPPDVSSAMDYPVVCTPVNTSVSPIGAATFSVPIEGPQGVGTAVPQLSISYNSMQGNGILGLGCGVSGLSAITRSVRDIYHDRNAGRLSFNEYDALRLDGKRLDEWNTTKYKYSADGNIMSFPIAGEYTYSSENPHAVIGVTNPGGKIPSTAQVIDYNNINKTDRISEEKSDGLHALDFYYGPDNERWIAEYQKDTENVKSVHYGDDCEKVEESGNVREFTYLGNGLLYYMENGGQGKLLYMFTDAQGSITDIFDADGCSVFQAEYDPWGNMTVTKNDIGFIRGYTGHEMLPEFGMINMNGRMYDPQLGRFLSPDNYIQMPENSQNFNRYSYCLNNPLKYTDPSGEFLNLVFGAAIGGLFNWASHGFKYNAKGLGYFFTGAIAGAVSTGIASGVNVAMAGGSFWNGAIGMANGISSTGFLSGAAAGAAAGFAGGFITGFGNSLLGGNFLSNSVLFGLKVGLQGGLGDGIYGGIVGGIDAFDKGTDFWDGSTIVNIDGAFSCVETESDGIIDKFYDKCKNIVCKYVGDFEGQSVYESGALGECSYGKNYRGYTLPNKGIFVGKKVFTGGSINGRAMMQHEFGHVLQYRIVGEEKYYKIIAKESILNCSKIPPYNKVSHDLFWTETWANYLPKQYFGVTWHGLDRYINGLGARYYPAKNISLKLKKEKFGL